MSSEDPFGHDQVWHLSTKGGLRLTWEQVIGRRLARQHLLRPAPGSALAHVAADICGVHAQMAPSAELMLGLRVAGITRQDVRAALWETRALVKTVGLRGTLHLLPAEEVPLWMAANRLRFEAEERRRRKSGLPHGPPGRPQHDQANRVSLKRHHHGCDRGVTAQKVADCLLQDSRAMPGDDADGDGAARLLDPQKRICALERLAQMQAVQVERRLTHIRRRHAPS